jgi:hypothetical protein
MLKLVLAESGFSAGITVQVWVPGPVVLAEEDLPQDILQDLSVGNTH